ncbi:MAG TPA: hypothetical protein VF515_05030 [Candidatus Binatia bacterium]
MSTLNRIAVVTDAAAEAIAVVLGEPFEVATERVGGHGEQGGVDAGEVTRR